MNRIKSSTIILLSLGLFFLIAIPVLAESLNNPFPIPGRTQGTGTFFEITDSSYLNISLQSSEEITVILESVPKTISLYIEASSVSTSTTLTLSNLEPNKTYYKYEDSYKNEVEFTTDQNGKYIFTQGLIKPHHIWFQKEKGTIFIPDNCTDYGIWDSGTSTCTLTQDLTESVEITADNITLDCDGHSIIGIDTGYGIYSKNSDLRLKNCIVDNFTYGIRLGFYPYFSQNNIVENNEIRNNYTGISFYYLSSSSITNNILLNNRDGIYLINKVENSSIINNQVSGNEYYGIIVRNSNNNTFDSNISKLNSYGIALIQSNNNTLTNNITSENKTGIIDLDSSNNVFSNNTSSFNEYEGFFIQGSSDTLANNTANYNNQGGIWIHYQGKNTLLDNSASNNYYGIILYSSSENILTNNVASNNQIGISLDYSSKINLITESNIFGNNVGLSLGRFSENNKIYHNNFIDNDVQVYTEYIVDNIFDNGYPNGGNYWSDYTGIDLYSGLNQDQPGSDRIGDTPYTFTGGQDRYPFTTEDGWGVPVPEKWSFAIITDLHIGKNYPNWRVPDYDGKGWDDTSAGEEYIVTKYLGDTINFINSNKEKYNIAFVVVTGDLTDSAELSEMNKAKEILNTLEIPWIPMIGNHDVWPNTLYVLNAPEIGPDGDGTDKYFNDILSPQYEKIGALFQNWEKESVPILNPQTDPERYNYFQNFAFDFDGYHFIGLDFNYRDDWISGTKPQGELYNFLSSSWNWFTNHLQQYANQHLEDKENIILFSHHAFRKWKDKLIEMGFSENELNTINNFLKDYKDKIAFQFVGHSHKNKTFDFYDIMPIIETGANVDGPLARIVQFSPDGKIDYSKMLGDGIKAVAHSPVDLEITDPDGLRINKQINEILGANYFEEDIDEDDEPDDIIEIPERKTGEYQIRVIPEVGAVPEDTYTLEVSILEDTFGYVPILLVEDTPISEIPIEPYIFESKERKATQITYTGEFNGQYSDQVNLSAVLSDIDSNPLINKPVIFEIGDQSISTITNESGIASAVLVLNQIPGQYYLVETNFAGDEDYLPSVDSEDFEILKENTIVNVIEKEGFVFDEIILEAQIKDDDGQTLLLDTEIEFRIDGKIIGTVKINEEGIATIGWQVDLIPKEITEAYLIEVIFAGNDYYESATGQADFILKTAKWLKEDAILELELAKTGDKKNDKEIDKIIWFINQSLDENLWIDASHLIFFEKGKCENLNLEKLLDKDELDLENISLKCLKSGIAVFYYERMAVKLMMPRPIFKAIIEKLIKADKLLAQVSLFDAQNTPIKNPKFQKIIENQIKKAEEEIQKAEKELEKNRFDKAIMRLAKSWLHSQLAIKFANLQKEP